MVSCNAVTGANQFTRQTSVAMPEFAVDKPKLTLSSAINNPALSMQNHHVLTSPKTMWLLKPGQNLATSMWGLVPYPKSARWAKVTPRLLCGAPLSRLIYFLSHSPRSDNYTKDRILEGRAEVFCESSFINSSHWLCPVSKSRFLSLGNLDSAGCEDALPSVVTHSANSL